MKTRASLIVVISLLIFGFAVTDSFAATLVVTKTADTTDGVCDADCSLREAVTTAANGDTIVFSPLFNSLQQITLTSGQISISRNLTVAGPGAETLTVSGNNTSRIFFISNAAVVTLTGMKIGNGRVNSMTDFFGGGIRLDNSTLTLTLMILSNNEANTGFGGPVAPFGIGGAIFSQNSTLSIINSTINNNSVPDPFPGIGQGAGICSFSGTVNISNSSISNNSGEGVFGNSSAINVSNSTINGNTRTGLYESGGNLYVLNSTISNNSGGIFNGSFPSSLVIDRSVITGNCCSGSGVSNAGTTEIRNTTISGNTRNEGGGGVSNGGVMSIKDSTIHNNVGKRNGGGISNTGQLFVTNSTLSGNSAPSNTSPTTNGSGGGIYNDSVGNFVLTNSTLTNNGATGSGGGLCHVRTGTVAVRNTIIAGNSNTQGDAPDVSGTSVSQGFNLIGNTAGSSGWLSSDLLNQNPRLVPLGNNGGPTLTHALMPNSVAINAGNNLLAVDPTTNLLLQYDQRGRSRNHGCVPICTTDIGAYEANFAGLVPAILSGRILSSAGRSLSNTRITLTDTEGMTIYSQTNPFGYYRFYNLLPGTTYTVTVSHKYYEFGATQLVTIDYSRFDLNFVGQ